MRKPVALLLFCALAAHAGVPELETGVYVRAGNGPLTVKTHTAPSTSDWNNDGKKDLLVGQFDSGNIWLYLNQGTDAQPAFTTGQQLRVGASVITTSYG
jgi:hypothetical protein